MSWPLYANPKVAPLLSPQMSAPKREGILLLPIMVMMTMMVDTLPFSS